MACTNLLKNYPKNNTIKIFTTRNLLQTAKWVFENNLINYIDDVTNNKGLSYLLVDDRCINFDGNYKDLLNKIDNFQVWYKK